MAANKYSWSLLSFHWQNSKWCLHTQSFYLASLMMLDPAGQPVTLHHCEPTEACKAVGIYQALSSSMSPQFSHLCQQADSTANAFATGHLPLTQPGLALLPCCGLTFITPFWSTLSLSPKACKSPINFTVGSSQSSEWLAPSPSLIDMPQTACLAWASPPSFGNKGLLLSRYF